VGKRTNWLITGFSSVKTFEFSASDQCHLAPWNR